MEKQTEQEYIFIPDEEGNEEKFEVIFQFDYEDKKYLLVSPADQEDEDEAEVYAFRYEENEEGMELYTIQTEEEWDIIEEVFNTLNEEFEA